MSGEREARNDAAVGNSVSGGGFHAPVVQAGTFTGGVHTYYTQPAHPSLPPVSEWPQLGTADPIALGVRRTRRLPGESPLPPYVERHCDRALGARVREAVRSGGLVVVTGAPLSGKTRTLWAALFSNLSGTTRIFAPSPGTDLRGLPALLRGRGEQGCVVWLDGLEGHLGEHGLTSAVLAELVRLRVPVLATMDDETYDARRFGTAARAGVLGGAEPVELQRVWNGGELWCLAGLNKDPRLRDAQRWCGEHPVPEYLAVGPELVEEWRRARRPDAHPRGHLLVRAAIDLVRCGVPRTEIIGVALKAAAQGLYPEEFAAAGAESFEDGFAWAAGIRHGVTGLLTPGRSPDTWTVHGSLCADGEARPDSPPIPPGAWPIALHLVPDARAAEHRAEIARRARESLESRAEGNSGIVVLLGYIHDRAGELDTARHWYSKAAEAGNNEVAATLGELLASRDAAAEAIPYLEQAAEAGVVRAQYLLGTLLAAQAESWLTRAAEAGHPAAARALPALRTVTDTPPDTVKA
ncbi:sel1 repeat family protein [Streptomyces anulatus]